ncbi:hypothetical protein BT93_L3371 [Corymbia citriodora subsp. variegata]|uniref:RING-type domain-containing protein n=1 Tax=Corymbia citriodora subsp. variegata TaxID=360336 RepID=A0A8T0CJX1_CORYI|nr:hypothetical protein BT93_L3371 [Corymbia citriodora subsp. variegata]
MVNGFLLFFAVYSIAYQLQRRIQNRPPAQRRQGAWALLLVPLTLWLCVSASLRYGYYGDSRMVISPSSSRLIKVSSLFIDRVEVRDEARKGVSVYGFSEKPQLSYETNWTMSNYLIVGSYNRKLQIRNDGVGSNLRDLNGSNAAVQGFNLWLNRGSQIRMRWEAQTSHLNQLQVALIKGELKYETLQPSFSSSPDAAALKEPINFKEAEYFIEEDDKYYVRVINANSRSIIMSLSMNVSSKIYDITKAKIMCSTLKGSCQLKLLFPNTQYVGDLGDWYIKLSFAARVVTYIAILGFIVIVNFLILKYLGLYDFENEVNEDEAPQIPVQGLAEVALIRPEELESRYRTNDDDDGESCVICCDEQRNCSFVPCGHSATCYDCAQRYSFDEHVPCNMCVTSTNHSHKNIYCRIKEESKACPFCRRSIDEVNRLVNP